MMPPVSLPLNAGTGSPSAPAGAAADRPYMTSRPKAATIRITISIRCAVIVKCIGCHGKNAGPLYMQLSAGVAALHLTLPRLRGTLFSLPDHPGGSPHA